MSASAAYQLSIEDLPDEMLEKVFKMLDSASLKNCCLVSQRWNSGIGQNLNLMRQLPLSLKSESLLRKWKPKPTLDFNRKVHTIIIRGMKYDWNDNALKLLRKHGHESHLIQFDDCVFPTIENRTPDMFHKMLKSFRNVEKITFLKSNIGQENYKQMEKIKPVNFPRLKSVVLSSSGLMLLEFIKLSQLKSLKVADKWDYGYRAYRYDDEMEKESLVTFLATQTKLEELALRNVELKLDLIELSDIEKIKMPLKRLSLKLLNLTPNLKDEEYLLAFLNRFAGTLEELELEGSLPDSVFEMIFKKFKKLRVVKINANDLPEENVFYHNLCPNNAVRKLVIDGHDDQSIASMEGFIGSLPNIVTLELNNFPVPGELMQFIANNLRRLESLHVCSLFYSPFGNTFYRARLPSVRTISFENMSILTADVWKQVVKALPNIETMSVQETWGENILRGRDFNIFTKGWADLTHLKLGKGFVTAKRKFNKLLRNCEKIQTVEMPESAFDYNESLKTIILRDFKKDGLRFIVHADRDIHKIFHQANGLWSDEDVDKIDVES